MSLFLTAQSNALQLVWACDAAAAGERRLMQRRVGKEQQLITYSAASLLAVIAELSISLCHLQINSRASLSSKVVL